MNHYIDPVTNELYAYDDAQVAAGIVKQGLEPLTDAQVAALRTPPLAQVKQTLVASIDSHIAGIYTKFQRFQMEYTQREAAAQAYKDAGYAGTYSPWIDSFSNAAGLSINAATDLILSQAANLRGALTQLGALRMQKYSIQSAADEAAAQAVHDQIIAEANAIAAQL